MVIPAALSFLDKLAMTSAAVESSGSPVTQVKALLSETASETELLLESVKTLEAALDEGKPEKTIEATAAARKHVDNLERLLPDDLWPLPSYAEMMFMM